MPSLLATGQTFSRPIVDGRDSYALLLGSQEPDSRLDGCVISGLGTEWALKMPNNAGSRILGGRIEGGRERALDVVRGADIEFSGTVFDHAGQRAPTTSRYSLAKTCDVGIKAGAQVTLRSCVLTDLLAGDYSIYDNPSSGPKARVVLDRCHHPRAEPIIIRTLWAEVQVIESAVTAFTVPAFATAIYFAVERRFGDTRRAA